MTAAALQGAVQTPSTARTWRDHFPDGDLWVFGYGYVVPFESAIEYHVFSVVISNVLSVILLHYKLKYLILH